MRRILWTTAVAMLLTGASAQAQEQGKKVAVVVGVGQYKFLREDKQLQFTENDAVELTKLLRNNGYEVTLLCDSAARGDANLKPTRANILKHVGQALDNRVPEDLVLIALAGHGEQPLGVQDSFFLPFDADPHKRETHVAMSQLFGMFGKCNAGSKILLVDACRDAPKQAPRLGFDEDNLPKLPEGTAALFSCKQGERAYEDKELRHGIFFHFVLKGLRGEAANRHGEVNLLMLAGYVQREVENDVARRIGEGAKQTPYVKLSGAGSTLLLKVSFELSRTDSTPQMEKPRPLTASTVPLRKELLGAWSSETGVVVHLLDDSTAIHESKGVLTPFTFRYARGGLNVNWTTLGTSTQSTATWVDPSEKTRFRLRVTQSDTPGISVGTVEEWRRINRATPVIPTANDLVGRWTDGDVTVDLLGNGTMRLISGGNVCRGTYRLVGNVLTSEYPTVGLTYVQVLRWNNAEKSMIENTVLKTNDPLTTKGVPKYWKRVQ